jgi:glycosyltransferase involved in cell wall biosynthesis
LDRLQPQLEAMPEVTVRNGFIESDDLVRAIQSTECIVLPYLRATQSGVAAGAFAGRRYVVASDAGGLRDVVRHGGNGLLVPPGDSAALAEALRVLAEDQAMRRRLLDGAAATASGPLDWDRIVDHLDAELSGSAERPR